MKLMKLDLLAPHQKYLTESGEEVPGVTTIVGATLGQSQALSWWFWDQGRQGTPWPIPDDKTEADLGKLIHARVEAYLRGYDGIDPGGLDPDLIAKSDHGFERFIARWESSDYKVLNSELQMVSEVLRCGGTLDIEAECSKRGPGIVDIKSSKPYRDGRPYDKVLVQCGGYSRLRRETGEVRWVEVWRVGKGPKDAGDVYQVKDLHACERAFESAVEHFCRLRKIG